MHLIIIYRAFHLKAAECTFPHVHMEYFLGQITGQAVKRGKFKKTEIISSIFSEHNTMRLEINYKEKKNKKLARNKNTQKLTNKLLNNQWSTGKIKEQIKKYLETNENRDTVIQYP